jgi:hypothetical protein
MSEASQQNVIQFPTRNSGNGARETLLQILAECHVMWHGNPPLVDQILGRLWMEGFKVLPLTEADLDKMIEEDAQPCAQTKERDIDHLLWRLRHNETAKHLCGLAADAITRLRPRGREAIEAAAKVAENGCLVPPDGGSPTEGERLMCEDIAKAIRALTPPEPDK